MLLSYLYFLCNILIYALFWYSLTYTSQNVYDREWTWANDNVLALSKELNATDAEYFNFRLHDLDWREYWLNYFIALRTHYFKVH